MTTAATAAAKPAALTVTSTAFANGQPIPVRYTCSGQSISPPLAWSGAPPQTAAFALVVDDPDAPSGVFAHWLAYNLPSGTKQLAAGQPAGDQLPGGGLQGKNGGGRTGYTGPCPPPGSPHHYRFTVYALSAPLPLGSGASRADVLRALGPLVIAQGELVGTYGR